MTRELPAKALRTAALGAALAVGLTARPGPASANPAPYPVQAIRVANAPIELTGCGADVHFFGEVPTTVEIANRTNRNLLAFKVRVQYFDAANAVIGTSVATWHLADPLAGGDQSSYGAPQLQGPTVNREIARQTCRIQSASFAGRSWSYGAPWREKLRPVAADVSVASPNVASVPALRASGATRSGLRIDVANAWNDALGSTLYVHDTVLVHGGPASATLRASDFILTMALQNGAAKAYGALSQQVPSYAKTTLGSTASTAYEVDPREDLGALGAIVVPANGTVRVTVTFVVSDAVSDPNANRGVTLR